MFYYYYFFSKKVWKLLLYRHLLCMIKYYFSLYIFIISSNIYNRTILLLNSYQILVHFIMFLYVENIIIIYDWKSFMKKSRILIVTFKAFNAAMQLNNNNCKNVFRRVYYVWWINMYIFFDNHMHLYTSGLYASCLYMHFFCDKTLSFILVLWHVFLSVFISLFFVRKNNNNCYQIEIF